VHIVLPIKMKLQKSFIVLTCTLILTSFICQDSSKSETVDWVKSRAYYSQQPGEKHYKLLEIIDYDYDYDTLYYKVQNYGSDIVFRINAVPIRNINPERVRIVRLIGNSGDRGIELYTNYGKENIMTNIYLGKNDPNPVRLTYSKVTIYLPASNIRADENVPDRMENAFKHLIRLSGGKGEKL